MVAQQSNYRSNSTLGEESKDQLLALQ